MSTEYPLTDYDRGMSLIETSGKADLCKIAGYSHREGRRKVLVRDLTADELALMAVEMLKVASYMDPEAIQRTAQKLGEKPDWDYYQSVIRDLL